MVSIDDTCRITQGECDQVICREREISRYSDRYSDIPENVPIRETCAVAWFMFSFFLFFEMNLYSPFFCIFGYSKNEVI